MRVPTKNYEIHKGEDWVEILQRGQNPLRILSSSNTSPIVITTQLPHGYSNGDDVRVYGHDTNTAANGNFTVTNVTATTCELNGSSGNGTGTSTGYIAKCVDGTGGAIRCQFRENVADSVLLTQQPTVSWLDQSLLRFKLTMPDTLTSAIDVSKIHYDIFFDDASGEAIKILTGTIAVIESTTRP